MDKYTCFTQIGEGLAVIKDRQYGLLACFRKTSCSDHNNCTKRLSLFQPFPQWLSANVHWKVSPTASKNTWNKPAIFFFQNRSYHRNGGQHNITVYRSVNNSPMARPTETFPKSSGRSQGCTGHTANKGSQVGDRCGYPVRRKLTTPLGSSQCG